MNKSEQLVHFVSTGRTFPYFCYIGVMTALKVYGDKVRLRIIKEPNSKYFEALKGKVKIIRVPADDIPDFPALADLSEDEYFWRVAIFDYLIWKIVYKYGGMIMGLDSITLRPHFDLLEDDRELMAPKMPDNYSMHGVIVRKGSKVAKLVINDALRVLNSRMVFGGDAGIKPFERRCIENLDRISVAPLGLCPIIRGPLFMNDFRLNPDVRTIALGVGAYMSFTGCPPHFIRRLGEVFVAQSDCVYAELIKKMLSEEEWNGSL